MDEFKIWALEDASSVVELQSQRQMEAESLLEDTLVKNPDLLMPGLRLVGRQTPTAGGPLDLLGVDRYGRLSLFELKRDTLTREAVAQVIDYAADLEAKDLAELADLLARESGSSPVAAAMLAASSAMRSPSVSTPGAVSSTPSGRAAGGPAAAGVTESGAGETDETVGTKRESAGMNPS